MRSLLAIASVPLVALMLVEPRPIVITGRITNAVSGQPIEGAQVLIADVNASAVTNVSGTYVLRATRLDDSSRVIVRVRAIGYSPHTESLQIRPKNDTVTFSAALAPDVTRLSEVVVTGVASSSRGVWAAASVASGTPLERGRVRGVASKRGVADAGNTEEYGILEENLFLAVSGNPLSTLSADVDRASYANVRRFIRQGQLPPKGAVRIEELLNYFTYDYAAPVNSAPLAIHADVAPAPWSPDHRIVRIGLQAKRIETAALPPANLVFLIDVSGSMMPAEKLPLVKQGFRLLVDQLREQDRVAIVVYAGAAGLVLPSTPASDKATIIAAIDHLEAGGSTAGGAGIRLAYEVAKNNFRKDGNNRVILATDGDFNVGISNTQELVDFVAARRGDGVFLTVLGFGMGNLKDHRMEQLADKGNGNYAYIDEVAEARKVFVAEFGGTLFTVAKDVKIQVEFNPETVQAYRLIGYENRLLAKEDFENDTKDAGEVGAGHTMTALYEIVPVGAPLDVELGSVRALRYQTVIPAAARTRPGELMNVSVRYKEPDGDRSRLIQAAVMDRRGAASADARFAMAVAGYGMLLHRSVHVGKFDYDAVLRLADDAVGTDREGYRSDFVRLVRETKAIATRVATRDK